MATGAEVLIVGAGPAGIATAIAASQKGLRVTVVDARKPPINKPCGEGLLPEGVSALQRLGIWLDSSVAFPIGGLCFSDEASSACGQNYARCGIWPAAQRAARFAAAASRRVGRFLPLGHTRYRIKFRSCAAGWRGVSVSLAGGCRRAAIHCKEMVGARSSPRPVGSFWIPLSFC